MKQYIVYTEEGNTTDNDGQDIENLQILALVEAEDLGLAIEKFYEENKYLEDYSFGEDAMIVEYLQTPIIFPVKEENDDTDNIQ